VPGVPLRIDLTTTANHGATRTPSAGRVAEARRRALHRLTGTGWRSTSDIPPRELTRRYSPDPDATDLLQARHAAGEATVPQLDQVLAVAWTFADLDGTDRPGPDQVTDALAATGLATFPDR
jgi:magnesium chelatase family protein